MKVYLKEPNIQLNKKFGQSKVQLKHYESLFKVFFCQLNKN